MALAHALSVRLIAAVKAATNVVRQTKHVARFEELSAQEYKQHTQNNWTAVPCGTNYAGAPPLTREYFEEIDDYRYRTHPWIREAIHRFPIQGRRVLEIGYGAGADHMQLIGRGGEVYGIDLTEENFKVTSARLKQAGLAGRLRTGDAESLPFENDFFEFVYSFGVVHHTPDSERVIREIYRVLKPGGRAYITVYNKNSIFFWWTTFLVNFVLRGGWRVRTLNQQISLIEHPNSNENLVIRLYTKRQFSDLFKNVGFESVTAYVRHLIPGDIAYLGSLYRRQDTSSRVLDLVGRRFGWYIVVEARK